MSVETWIVGILLTAVELIITTVLGLIIKKAWDKKEKEHQELEALREEKRQTAENARCDLMKDTIHVEVEGVRKDFKTELEPIKDDLDNMKKGMQKDIRRSLRQDGEVLLNRGYATQAEKTEFDELYWAYHNLGRNGVMDTLHDQIMNLPNKPKGE